MKKKKEIECIIFSELRLGIVASVSAAEVRINLRSAGLPSGTHFRSGRYGKGEVGEFVIIEGQTTLVLGRIVEIRLPERERHEIHPNFSGNENLDAIGTVQLLGTISSESMRISSGVDQYPRLGDRVYSAPHQFLAEIPTRIDSDAQNDSVQLCLGTITSSTSSMVSLSPEKLFGRHCAILGTTGGGKSWTAAKMIEECAKHSGAKIILIDATGEYRNLTNGVVHCPLGKSPISENPKAVSETYYVLPPTSFNESDFIALFEPSGKVQGPKMREAIRSLRLAKLKPALANNGVIIKANQEKQAIQNAEKEHSNNLENPSSEFDVTKLAEQIWEECVWSDGFTNRNKDTSKWGDYDNSSQSYCLTLVTRIKTIIASEAFHCIFSKDENTKVLTNKINDFANGDNSTRILRICMSHVPFEYKAREVVANTLGRFLLTKARSGDFLKKPLFIVLDEAHHFLGRQIGSEDTVARLDAFELIAREGRKFGLNVCFATQRPRDITESVLSQVGTLIVHRLTNDRDRDVVERACGEIDRSVSAFLPNLKPGEAMIIGVDFPIPLTIRITPPENTPISEGPRYQAYWTENTSKPN